jgi:hypothetical protein
MPIRRLFGLLVCALSLSSTPILAQTVSFVDGTGAEASSYLEETEARVRVTDSDPAPLNVDTVQVTLTADLSGDSEVLELRETDRDSGVFEGRIKLVRGATPSQAGILETGFSVGPPAAFETLTAEYGAATDTAAMAAARIQLLDDHGRPATAYTGGDWVNVRVEDHVRADDPGMRDVVSVQVRNPDMGDVETVPLTETALRTGVFEGRIRHLFTNSPASDGIVGGYPGHQISAGYGVPGYADDLAVSVPLAGSRVEILGGDGLSTSLIPESSPLRLRVINRAAADYPTVETVDVVAHSQLTGDQETVFLTETGPVTGIFEGTLPMTVFGSTQTGDGTLRTAEDLGPPHRFDEVSVSYQDDYNYSGIVWASAATYASETRFTDAEGKDVETYAVGFPAWVRVEDHNSNQPAVVDTIQATVESLTAGDSEGVILTETGQDTGVFAGSIAIELPPWYGSTQGDGRIQAEDDETLRALHGDALGMTASGDLARVRTSRLQFVDEEGRPVSSVVENGTVRVRLEWLGCHGFPYSDSGCFVVLTSRITGDEEVIPMTETGPGTGVFLGEIFMPFSFGSSSNNSVLEISNSGSPEYLADEITATAGPNFARVPAVAFTLRFIHADGSDAATFSPGEAVWLRLEDQGVDDPYAQQTETLQVRVFGSPEAETVQLIETGTETGVYVGSLPLRFNASPPVSDGTLDVEIGSRLLADWTHPYDSREARDEAVVSGTAPTTPEEDSPVTFRDAYGNSATSYAAGTTAYVRVVDGEANLLPTHYDFVQVTLSSPTSGDSETVYLRETTRDSGIFEGSVDLDASGPSWNAGLYCVQGEEIEAVYGDFSDEAMIRYSSATFIDEDGKPAFEVLENSLARLRVVTSSPTSSVTATVSSSQAADQVSVLLTETFPGSQVFEGTVQLSFVPPGGGMSNNLLETSTGGGPDYPGDELTVTYQDAEGTAVTIPSRVQFIDGYGRVTATFAVGERVGVRVEDHNLDDPQYKEQIQVLVREAGTGDANSVTLIETGFDTNVYEGSIATEDAPVTGGDGKLQLSPGQVIEAERLNQHTPHPTVAQATMAGASVVFVDAEGKPADLYFERTRAYVRVSDTFASSSITVTLQTFLGLDSESLSLTETGPSTGVFEGSIPLSTGGGGSGHQNNGYLETSQYGGPPAEYDTLTASYQSVSGTVSGTAGMIGSRTWFIDAYGNETDGYVAGTSAYMRVEDHVAGSMPGYYDYAQVTVSAPMTGDSETAYLRETTRDSGVFEGALSLGTGTASSGDGRLQAMTGEEIEVVYEEQAGNGGSSDEAMIRYSSAEFIDESGEPTGEVLENGVARLRVVSASASSTVDASVTSSRGADQVTVTLAQTFPGSQIYEGTVQLSFVPPGGGMGNSLLETSTSGSPDYLGDDLTVMYQDGVGQAVTIPSRVRFIDGYGRVTTTFAVGERVGMRVEDHNLDDPQYKEQIQVLVHEVGSGDANSVTLIETGFDTNVYEGSIATEDGPVVYDDGKLQLAPGRVIQAERLNQHTPYPTVARATMSGASVLFVDAEGRPAELYYEGTRAYVRVSDTFAANSITVTLQTSFGLDSESLTLAETGSSTGVFEGSIPLLAGGSSNQNNGYLETSRYGGPPVEYDTLTASYQSVSGTVSGTAGITGSRTWFIDAYGNETDSYTAGTTAYVRVEDHVSGSNPAYYDYAQVTLTAPMTGDSETTYLRETTRDSGIFEGPVSLVTGTASSGDGRLQAMTGEEIEVVHEEQGGNGGSSDTAMIRYSSAEFIDEAGEPTGEVLENGVARLRVTSTSPGSTVDASVTSSRAADQVTVTLTETFPGSKVYEGSVQLSFVPPGGGMGNSLLETSTSGSPDYLGDELAVTYQDGLGRAVTIPSRVRFIDSYGRVTTTFAVGERVGVRVEDHNLDDPQYKEQIQVVVREVGPGDANSVTLIETGYDTNVYEGSIATEDGPVAYDDGKLQLAPGRVIEAERLNQHTPYPTRTRATMAGASVLFIDAQGQPAELYYEGTRAYVRVSDTFAANSITVTLQTFFGLDSESLTLTETGPSTGVFEGSIQLGLNSAAQNNGVLETAQYGGPPTEFDVLTATYQSIAGTVSGTVGTLGSRTWFVDAYGNETDSYTAGTTAYVRVEDHVNGSNPAYYDYAQVNLTAPTTGDSETTYLRETTRDSGIFEGPVSLGTGTASSGDGRLQSAPGEEIQVVHGHPIGYGSSSDKATIRYSFAEFIDEAGEPTGEVLENGVARLRVTSASPGSTVDASVTSSRAADQVTVTLTETFPGSKVYEGSVQLSFVPPGGGMGNSLLKTSTSGSPDYLGDELTVTYQDGVGRAVTIPSRVRFIDGYGRVTTTFAVGEQVGVRVEDHNLDDPQYKEQIQVVVRKVGQGDANSVTLIETGFDTNVYEGSIATEDAPVAFDDGKLQLAPGQVIEAERLNQHTPNPTRTRATMVGASVLFIDAQGQPAELYYEGTRAYVRVSDTFAANSITVTLHTFFGLDSESVSLTETGPSTGVFEGSIPLGLNSAAQNNGVLETAQYIGPPTEFDILTASYQSVMGTVSDTVGTLGSRTWFIDAYGNETDSYTAGTTAYVRVEDHVNGSNPAYYDYAQVNLTAPTTGDTETTYLRETTRDSGIFEGPVSLGTGTASSADGRLQSAPGEEIQVAHSSPGGGYSSDKAVIRYSFAEFIDEAGEPTGEVLENGIARLRVTSASPGSTVDVSVTSSRAADQVTATLAETFPGSKVYEGSVQLSFVPPGGGMGNSLLETSTSGSPDYLGDELTVTYQDGVGHAVTIPSRVRFIDSYGRVTTTFAVGEQVGVRVEDHNLDDPQYKEQIQVLVREVGQGDANSVTLIETGYDTNVYEGSIATEDAPVAGGDGKLQLMPGRVIEAERLNQHTPNPTRTRATMSGASVLFIDAQGQPAELYYEGTRAYVRVSDTFAANSITVTLHTIFGLDSESLTLTETGPSTGVFEGSIPLSLNSATQNNGILETAQDGGPPTEFDTLTATYQSIAGTVSDIAGTLGSRTWFVDAYGNLADSYTAGTTAHVRVEDHVAGGNPAYYDYAQVTLYSLATGDTESLYLMETTRDSGIFEGAMSLGTDIGPSGDGRLQSAPGEEIEAVYHEPAAYGISSDKAVIRYSSAEFIDEAGEPTGEILENGVARLRVASASPGSSVDVSVTSSRAADQVTVTLFETFPGSKVYHGSVQLSFVPPGGGTGNSLLETSTSGSPDYLGDELTLTYQDGAGHAVTIPSRVQFVDGYGQVVTTFAVGERVGVRVEDHNLDDPQFKEQIQVLVRAVGQGDANSVTLIETGYDTNVYEGSIETEDAAVASGDGKLQLTPGQMIEAERLNQHTPNATVARATMSGGSVVFIDTEGRPAETFFESTPAYVRVSDTFADSSPSADQITVTVESFLAGDSESLTLTETGPSTGVFEGSIQTAPGSANSLNGVLETGWISFPPEYDTLTARYASATGTVSDTVGMIGSRTGFTDLQRNPTDSYAAGSTAYFQVEDHTASGIAQLTLRSLTTGDVETVSVYEGTSGLFNGSMMLERTATPVPGDGKLQSMPGEEIEAEHTEVNGQGRSVDRAEIREAEAIIFEAGQAVYGQVLENGVARIRIVTTTPSPGGTVIVRSLYGSDEETVSVSHTIDNFFEGTIQLSFVPPGGGNPGNGTLETSNSGSPEYLPDELTVTYLDAEGHAVTVPSRITFHAYAENWPVTEYAVGADIRVRVQDRNANDPSQVDTTWALATAPGDSEGIALTETGADTGIFEGTLPSSGSPGNLQDGTLTAGPGTVALAEHLNLHTPNPTTAQVAFNGNFAPLAVDDAAQTEEEQPVTIDVLANDSDPDQEALTVGWPTQAAHGMVSVITEGIVYTPEAGFIGTDSFTYVASDPRGGESRATVTVTVIQGNEPPAALFDLASTQEDQAVNIDVLANDSDPDGDPLAVVAISVQPMSGQATIEPDNTITYTPNPNFNGSDGFQYEIEDPDGETATGAVTVFITPVNDPPVANDDAATVAEDSSVTVTVRTNDTDPENDALDVTAVTQGTNGAVVLNANDTVLYTPAANFHGADSFTYTVSDGTGGVGGTDTATVNVTVTPANDPPVAVDDTATTDEDTAVTVAVLANDTDPDNDTLDVVYTTGVTNGAAVVNANETVTFTPTAGFHGTVTFDYSVTDGNGGSDLGTVTITVNPVNDPPVANDDAATTDEDSSVTVNVLDNDTDPENDTLEVTAVTQGAHGTVTLDPVTYTPAANFHGADSFTYTVSDGTGGVGGTDTATVNVTINETNDAPIANDDTATVAEDSSVTVNVLGNDSDADNDTLNVTAVTQGTNGSVTLNPVTYTPNANFHGTDSFTYTVSDGNGGTDTATVNITISPINDPPVANDDTASVVEDDSVTVNVLGNDSDADNDTLTVTAVTQGAHGTVTLNPVTYTPSPNFFGTDSFTYTIADGNGGMDTATVTVTIAPSNDNLTANDDSATVAEDGSVTVTVLGNDSDPENDVLSVQSVTQGTNGSVAIVGSQVTYTPNANFHGADSFTYTASDGNGGTDSATVTITVTPVNDAPVAGDDTASVVEDGSVAITVLGNDADVDDDLLSVTSVTQGTHGTVVINGDDTVTYTPAADYNGSDSFTYTVSDGESDDTATVTVTVGAANDAPIASNDSASTSEDNPVTVTVLGNDTDPENDTLSVASVTQGTNGAVVINANNTVTYTPAANFHGADSFTYTASDSNGGTDTATVTVTISSVNDAPVANDDPASVAEDGSVTVAVLANDTDADNDTLTVTARTQGAHGTVTLNPVTYTPAANYNGPDTFTYTISDGHGGTDTATVNVTVGAANDAPVANNDTATVAEDGSVTVAVLTNDTDLDNDTLTVTARTQGAHGTVTLNPVTYTPAANYNGPDTFTYTISDGAGGTATATVNVTVTAVNDAPVAVNDSATTLAETPVMVLVRTNDTDVEGNTLTVTAFTQGAHGSVAINAGQSVTYTPATAWVGPDTFTYTISDGAGGTATATVNITVQAPPRVSTNIQVLYAFNEGSGTTVNDTSGVGTPLNLTVASASAVTWLPGALSINSNTLVQSAGTATKVINASKASNEVTVEAWVDPLNLTQTGPAAIVTMSQNQNKRDVTLGQSGTAYNGQLQTSTTGQAGTEHSANNVATTNLTHVVYTRSSTGAVRIYVNGTLVTSATLTGNLSAWANYNLALGGELSGTRYWRGELHLVAIYSRALTSTEVRQNWLAGAN